MEKFIIAIMIFGAMLTGCVSRIETMSIGGKKDIFREASCKEPMQGEDTDLLIIASLKTRRPDNFMWLKTMKGTDDYMFLFNIDGQVIKVKGDLKEERTAITGSWNPEAGEGIRYMFKRELCLTAGLHKVFVALPEDGVFWEGEIPLGEGVYNVLNLTPVYRRKESSRLPALDAETSFYDGIRGLRAYLNGKEI